MTLFVLLSVSLATHTALLDVRNQYHQAINNEKAVSALHTKLNEVANESYTFLGYFGAVKMLMAKYALMPTQKFAYFNEGKVKLEQAIAVEPENLELRYLRHAIQRNTPSFLGYNQNLNEDKYLLLSSVNACTDTDLKVRIKTYLIVNANLTERERLMLQ